MPKGGANANANPTLTWRPRKSKRLFSMPNLARRSVARPSSAKSLPRMLVLDRARNLPGLALALVQLLAQVLAQVRAPVRVQALRVRARSLHRLPSVSRPLMRANSSSRKSALNVSYLSPSFLFSDFEADWAQIDEFLARKLACTIVQQCNTHSAVSSADGSPVQAHDDPDDRDSMTSTELALFLSKSIVCDGCDSKLTLADVTGRGQLYVHIVQQVAGLVVAGLEFYVNCIRFPLPNAAHIFGTSYDNTVYEFGNACEPCCAKIKARADAATEYGPKFFAEASGVLLRFSLPKALVNIVLRYSCMVKLATEQCTADSCL